MSNGDLNKCRVCGFDYGPEYFPWGENGREPSDDHCDCCGTQFGYHDFTISGVLRKRNLWVVGGCEFWESRELPDGWDLQAQLRGIPAEFRVPPEPD